jgi:hypothetical protein
MYLGRAQIVMLFSILGFNMGMYGMVMRLVPSHLPLRISPLLAFLYSLNMHRLTPCACHGLCALFLRRRCRCAQERDWPVRRSVLVSCVASANSRARCRYKASRDGFVAASATITKSLYE